MYLAEFTDTHSRSVLKGDADVGPLIDVNTAIMSGLQARRQSA
jgi:flagellar protein FlaF